MAGNNGYIIGSHTLGIIAISFGALLIFVALIGGISLLLAFARGILSHTLNGIRQQVLELFLDFIAPIIGGIILAFTGWRIVKMERYMMSRNIVTSSKKRVIRQKEHMINTFLNNDEKRIIELVKEKPDGSLQSDLVIKTGYSKVKMHRILKNLENKGIIKRGRHGITNKVMLSNQ